jgi:hypothetical protein
VPCPAQSDDFGASAKFPWLVVTRLYLVSVTKSFLNGQWIKSANNVTAKATRALTEVPEDGFLEFFQKL